MTDSNLFSLSQADHPYYGAEGHEERYSSWAEFMEHGAPERDPDMNLLYRWDWKVPDEDRDQHELLLFYILQRKSYFSNVIIFVQPEDDAAIRAWLSEKLSYLLTLWTPVSTPAPATSGADVTAAVRNVIAFVNACDPRIPDTSPISVAIDFSADGEDDPSPLFMGDLRSIAAARAVSPAPAMGEVPPSRGPSAWWAETGTAGAGEGCNKPFWLRHEAIDYVRKHGGHIAPLFTGPLLPGAAPTAQQPQPADALSGEVAWKALAAILNATGTEDGEGEYRADDREGCLDFVEHTARAALRSRQSVQGEGRS